MNPLHKAKQDYEKQNIPADLDSIVNDAITSARTKKRLGLNHLSLTCAFLALILTLNLSPVFAGTLTSIPYIGELFRVFTSQHIETVTEAAVFVADIPAVNGLAPEAQQKQINDEIVSLITEKMKESELLAQQQWNDYLRSEDSPKEERKAEFFANYEVLYSSENTVSFVVYIEVTASSTENLHYYFNMNMLTGEPLSLDEIISEDSYIDMINQEILSQIAQRETNNPDDLYFHEFNEFQSIQENQAFFINSDGQLVIAFEEYEIAPGYMGQQTFIMPFKIELP